MKPFWPNCVNTDTNLAQNLETNLMCFKGSNTTLTGYLKPFLQKNTRSLNIGAASISPFPFSIKYTRNDCESQVLRTSKSSSTLELSLWLLLPNCEENWQWLTESMKEPSHHWSNCPSATDTKLLLRVHFPRGQKCSISALSI